MSNANIFERALRRKLRFPSLRGPLSVEQLWDLPLTSREGFDMDTVAKTFNAALKAETEESFVTVTKPNKAKVDAELGLEICKYVINVKQTEAKAAEQRAMRRQERDRLIAVLGRKQDAATEAQSIEEIRQRLTQLDEAEDQE